MNATIYFFSSALFNGLLGLFLVYYVYLRNPKNMLNRSFLYFGLAVSGWSLIYSIWCLADNARIAEMLVRTHMSFVAFIPTTFFNFAVNFTQTQNRNRLWNRLFFGIGLFWFALMFTPFFIAGTKQVPYFNYWPKPGPLCAPMVIYFGIVVFFSLALFIECLFKTSGAEKTKTFLVFIAFLIGFGGGSTNWFLWFDILIPPLPNFFVGIMFVIIAYAMVRYGLMDVDVLVEVARNNRMSALGIIFASINHELRNPLYIAKGKIETHLDSIERGIYKTPEDEIQKSRQVFSVANQQLIRAMDIIQRFSDFAKPQIKTPKKEDVVIREIFENVIKMVANEFEINKVKLAQMSIDSATVTANRRQLEEIFFNLILNACHAMEKNGGELRIRANEMDQKVGIEISDTGPGISKSDQRKIFEPFFTTKEKGTGLGLYIAKQLVERNGGKISVKSKPGEGTTFTLEFKR